VKLYNTFRRPRTALALTAAAALTFAACGGDTDNESAQTNTTEASRQTGPQAEFLTLKGVSTSVDLDAGTAKVLADNRVTVAPIEPATASTSGGRTTVSFPITQGYVAVYPPSEPNYIRGTFSHSGGLRFTAGGKSLQLTDFIVNPGDSTLTATVEGASAASVLDLDGTNVKVSQDAQGQTRLDGTIAKLSQTGADAMNKFFNVSIFKQGIPLGEVHVVATGTPAP
jgi:hypothetical protein